MGLLRISIPALILVLGLFAQTPQPAPAKTQVPGTIDSIDAAGQITIKTDAGESVTVNATPQTVVIRVPAGETDIKKGEKLALSALQAGDRVVAFVRPGPPLQATSLVVRTKADMAAVRAKESENWKTRGTAGTVSAVDPQAKSITVQAGKRSLTVHTTEKTRFRRYSPDSAKPSDARAGTLADVRPGDQMHVLGNTSPDGAVEAEEIYSGAFRQIAATIDSVDPATGEMKVTDLATHKPLTIRVTSDTVLKRMPPEMAQALARRYQNATPAAGNAGEGAPALDRLPAQQVSELKPKEAIMVSTTAGKDPGRVTAIMLLAGVEPLLTASPTATRDIMSGWNLGGGGDDGDQ